jgi:DNA-binding NarL/FixJ family response regulator
MTCRILIVDDHPLVALGLQVALQARGWQAESTAGPTVASVLELARTFRPHCVVLDVHLGGEIGSGVELIRPLVADGAAVVMLTGETDRFVLASCLEAGAAGWIAKQSSLDEVLMCIDDASAGRCLIGRTSRDAMLEELRAERALRDRALSPFHGLSRCEQRVLAALMDGMSAEDIAEASYVALSTVRSQIRSILRKLGVCSQLSAVALAHRAGWRPPAGERLVGAR